MFEVIVSPGARADLIAQWDFFADDVGNPALADRFAACAEATFKKLARTPGLGRVRAFTQAPDGRLFIADQTGIVAGHDALQS